MEDEIKIKEIILKFQIMDTPKKIIINDTGLINTSYIVKCEKKDYVLQKINTYVFNDPVNLMNNINLISNHLLMKNKENIKVIKTNDNQDFYVEKDCFYRCYNFIENSISFDKTNNLQLIYEFGRTLGDFHKNLNDFDAKLLHETIKDFHDTPLRLEKLINVYEHAPTDLKEEVKNLYSYIIRNRTCLNQITNNLKNKKIPYAVVHNDTKLNNCLFNKETNKGICLVDLDTVMAGSRLYDVGDALRSCASTTLEDSINTEFIDIDVSKFIYFMIGYLEVMYEFLNDVEVSLLTSSIIIISFECSIRFLTDYLDGNKYFHIDYFKHNLVRSKNQLTLAKMIFNRKESLDKIVYSIIQHFENC